MKIQELFFKNICRIFKLYFIVFTFFIGLFVLEGCKIGDLSKESKVEKALFNKYDEEFTVIKILGGGADWRAIVSPVNNNNIVFEVELGPDGEVEFDGYYKAYVGYLFSEMLREDLVSYFPDSYVRVSDLHMSWIGSGGVDFRKMNIQEIINNSIVYDSDSPYSGCDIEIYINKDVGTNKDYLGEYKYFTETIDKYVDEKKIIPLVVTFNLVDSSSLKNIEIYFSENIAYDVHYESALGVDRYILGICSPDQKDLGNPPNVTACFIKGTKGYIEDFEEYKRRREELDNVN